MKRQLKRWNSWASALLAAVLLCMVALWNGQPFFYPDTPTYLRGAEMGLSRLAPLGSLKPWMTAAENAAGAAAAAGTSKASSAATPASSASQGSTQPAPSAAPVQRLTSVDDKIVLAGRSVYYGALLYLSYLSGPGSSLWLAVLAQALCLAYLLQLALVRVWGLSNAQFLAATVGLGLFTPMAVYTGFLMPDIFAAVLIMCVALLSTAWARLRTPDRWAVSALLLYALMTHASHVVIAAGLMVLLLLARWLWPGSHDKANSSEAGSAKGLGVLAACLVLAVVAEAAFVKAVTQAVGAPPLRLPHPMARLIDAGPGTDFLKKNCPQANYAACAYVQNYPSAWTDFLFSSDPSKGAFALADAQTKRRMSDEQLRFALDVMRSDPLGVARVISLDVLRQLGRFDTDVWSYGKDGIALYFQGRVPPDVLAHMQASRAAQTTAYNTWFTLSNRIAVLAAILLFALAWPKRKHLFAVPHAARGSDPDLGPGAVSASAARSRFVSFAGVVLAGVAVNAAVCAALASSMDRFQARVVWLLPFLAVAGLLVWRAQRRAAQAASTADDTNPEAEPDRSPASPLLGASP